MLRHIKTLLRKVARVMAEWPVVGRFVKIGVAIIRLPEIKEACIALNHRQHVLETEQIPALQATISALNHRQHGLETERIPALQESISSLNYRQISTDGDRDNLVKSVPVALRKITRELEDIRNRLESATKSNARHIKEV
jgi:hypothetical protein